MTSTRLRRAAATIPLAVALATTTSAAPALAAPTGTPASTSTATAHVSAHVFHGPLRDLQPAAVGPFDNADARLIMVSSRRNSTTFVFVVTGIDRAAAGTTYGAHLHVGPCVAGDPAAGGPHYNRSVIEGASPPVVNDQTEVWLDFTVLPGGVGVATTRVPFVPQPGNRAVVIHAEATQPNGTAGARLACLPVSWS